MWGGRVFQWLRSALGSGRRVNRRVTGAFQALSKEDVANLRSCLQKVQKHREQAANATSATSVTSADPGTLKAQLAQAKELVAKVRRRTERPEAQSQQHHAEARDR